MTQGSLNFEQLSRRSDPSSSKRAARKMVESGAVASHEEIILNLVRTYPGRTAKQLAALCNLNDVAITRRGKGMQKKGLVKREAPEGGDLRWWAL